MESRGGVAAGVRWGVAWRGAPSEAVCGDLAVALPLPNGLLLGAVDGLGHGEEAASAARKALAVLKAHADANVTSLFQRCHEALSATRGVVMSLAAYLPAHGSEPCLSWLGVGNVEGLLVRARPGGRPGRETLLLRNGVVGYLIPPLSAALVPVRPGDVLVLATDGVRRDFEELVVPGDPPQRIADRILERCTKGWDDALVLAARFPRGSV